MSSQFYPGQRVVCVDDDGADGVVFRGLTYTVESVSACCGERVNLVECQDGYPGLRNCGTCNRQMPQWGYNLWAWRFRPLDSLSDQLTRIEEEAVSAPAEVETVPA